MRHKKINTIMSGNKVFFFMVVTIGFLSCKGNRFKEVLLRDDFSKLDTGLFSAPVGAHTEYHYLPEAAAKGELGCFQLRLRRCLGKCMEGKGGG